MRTHEGDSSADADPLRRLGVVPEALKALADRWRVKELSLFGSVLRHDFRADSDVDVLVVFRPEAEHSLLDLVQMREELEALFHRPVDLIERRALRNPFLRREILRSHRVAYAA